ncbi:MAG TPA: Mpo1-like protein [Usitatibacter sp.]|nr:Mpo1-like protein [Usitatibacter sp.]
MKGLDALLTQYAAYHRDRRNIATHFVGVPMIVFAIVLALATLSLPLGGIAVTAAAVVSIVACIYYLRLDVGFGVTMAVVLFAMCAGASEITHRVGNGAALGWALGIFTVGWALQFWGHRFEGMKPAFFDDAKQLLIGPLFVLAELFFLMGLRSPLRRHIEERVGATVARRDGRPLPLTEG